MTDSAQETIDAVVDIFRRQDGKQHLFTTDTLQTAILSLSAFYKAATHPYVIDKTKKYGCMLRFCVMFDVVNLPMAAGVQSL